MTQPPPETDLVPARRCRRAIVTFLCVAIGLLVVDLVVKHLAFEYVAGAPVDLSQHGVGNRSAIPPHDAVDVIPKVLSLKLVLNEGAVFGLGQGWRWIFVVISLVAVGVIGGMFLRSSAKARLMHLGLAMILSGAIGNMYDRLVYGFVRDMFWLGPGVKLPFGWNWPGGNDDIYPWIFNVADVALCFGVVILMYELLFGKHHGPRAQPTDETKAA